MFTGIANELSFSVGGGGGGGLEETQKVSSPKSRVARFFGHK